jgi:hypothetical protein
VKYKAFDVSQYFLYGRMKHMQWFGAYKQKFCARVFSFLAKYPSK